VNPKVKYSSSFIGMLLIASIYISSLKYTGEFLHP
jgi:hypothetical protein